MKSGPIKIKKESVVLTCDDLVIIKEINGSILKVWNNVNYYFINKKDIEEVLVY